MWRHSSPIARAGPLLGPPARESVTGGTDSRIRICRCFGSMDEITILQADVLRTLANPHRLDILHRLAREPSEVGRLASGLGLSQPNISQHLAVLRAAGLVEAERIGREVRYRLIDPDVMVACGVMRSVLERRLRRLADLSSVTPPATDAAPVVAERTALSPSATPVR